MIKVSDIHLRIQNSDNVKFICFQSSRRSKPAVVHEKRRKRKDSSSDGEKVAIAPEGPRQCYGPQCIRHARPGSKYCSDECGLKLAAARVYQVMLIFYNFVSLRLIGEKL